MRLHLVSADWYGGQLHLLGRDALGGLQDIVWQGRIDWRIEAGRHCVGAMGRDGHSPCPSRAPVTADRQCGRCAPSWSACVFEPIDHGDERCFLCQREHVVYLALYGALPKVGMTSSSRVDVRLLEQGADGYFVIQRRRDRRAARRTERSVAMLHGIPEFRRHGELFAQMHRPGDPSMVANRAAAWSRKLADRFDVEPFQEVRHPMFQVLPQRPGKMEPEGHHQGQARGAKGRYLFYEAQTPLGPAVRALKLGDLVGRTLELP